MKYLFFKSTLIICSVLTFASCQQDSQTKSQTEVQNKPELIAETASVIKETSQVNLYSARKEALIRPLLDRFTEETGIEVNIISSKADALLKRIQSEGINSPADVLITTDAGRLHRAKTAGIFMPISSETLTSRIPQQLRDSDLTWFGLSVRLRPIFITDEINPESLTTYQDLAKEEFKGKICIRSSSNIYNQSLIASMLETNGEDNTLNWAKGLVENFARQPQGGDRDQIRAAAAGQCSIAIANTYYVAQMLAQDEDSADHQAAKKLSIIWPNQNEHGVHANISGAGVIKTAPNKDNAIKLIEFLSSDAAQEIYANVNYEYPINNKIKTNDILASWGEFKADPISLELLGQNNPKAIKLMDNAGWK